MLLEMVNIVHRACWLGNYNTIEATSYFMYIVVVGM